MSPRYRGTVLALLATFLCAATLPCPPGGSSEPARRDHAEGGHGAYGHAVARSEPRPPCHEAEPAAEYAPVCPCGCDGATGATLARARLGTALPSAAPPAIATTWRGQPAPASVDGQATPLLAIDPVPI